MSITAVPERTLNLPSGARSTVKVQPSHIRRVAEASERRALVYVLIAATISWLLGWPRVAPLPLAPLGIALFVVAWILPVWAIVLFRREGTEVNPTSFSNRKLVTTGPYRFTRNPMVAPVIGTRASAANNFSALSSSHRDCGIGKSI